MLVDQKDSIRSVQSKSRSKSRSRKKISVLVVSDSRDDLQDKQNQVSPLVFAAEADRIRKTLQEMLAKIWIMFSLCEMIAKDPNLLIKYLGKEEAELILAIIKPQINSEELFATARDANPVEPDPEFNKAEAQRPSASSSKLNITNKKKFSERYVIADYIRIVDMVVKCKSLTEMLQRHEIEKHSSGSLIVAVQKLLEHIVEQLQAAESSKKERRLRTSYNLRLVTDENIFELEASQAKNYVDFKAKESEKLSAIAEYRAKLNNLRYDQKHKYLKIVADSEGEIMRFVAESEIQQMNLKLEAENAVQDYKKLLENNLKVEKDMQNKMKKIEMQLAAWMNKFDNDIGEKQSEIDRLYANIENTTTEMLKLQDLFYDQEDVYMPLMMQKAEEEQAEFEEVLYKFVCNRAARLIQRAWRAYLVRKANRKKRKGKKADGEKKESGKKKDKGKKDDKADDYVKGIEKRAKAASAMAKQKEKTLEEKFGDDLFEELKDDDPSAFQNR